jgi:hypothetical protein
MSDFSPRQMLMQSLFAYQNSRERSQQVEVGVSAIGGCARQVYHQIVGSIESQTTEYLPSLLGTFAHSGIEKALEFSDPFGDNHLKEVAVEFEGLKGHIDLYLKDEQTIVDWKTSRLSVMKKFPTTQQRYQVHIYGYLLKKSLGLPVKRVAIVCIPRDGKSEQIIEYVADYDEDFALEGIAWLNAIKDSARKEEPPPEPEYFRSLCALYCPFYLEGADYLSPLACPSASKPL